MPELFALADLGRAVVEMLALPLALWTLAALVAEGALRATKASAALALPVRGAMLAALPLSLLAPVVLSVLAPGAAVAVAALTPEVTWLPGVSVGALAPTAATAGPDPLHLLVGGLAVFAALLAAVRSAQFGVAVVRAVRLRGILPPAEADARAAVEMARSRLGVARAVHAAQAPVGAAPFTLGWRRPIVALPPDLMPDAREVAAVHEVAHVRRSDYAWHAAQRAVAAAFAAHPLVGVLARGLDLDRERAADAAVLAACPDRRRAYADLLFSYAALPAPPLALGAVGGSSALKSRIDAMTSPLSPAHARRSGWIGRLAGLALVAVVSLAAATTAPSPAEAAPSDGSPVERLHLHTDDNGAPESLDLYLVDGATEADARATADHADSDEPNAVPMPLRVHFGRRVYARDIRLSRGVTSFGGVSVGLDRSPARPLGPAAQQLATRRDTTEVVEIADEMPEIIGGLASVQERIVYPELQRRAGVEGTAVLQFIVSTEGTVEDLVVVRSSGNDGLDRAAAEAVRPTRFTPGRVDGEPVRVRFALPISFRLPPDADARSDDRVREVRPDPEGEDGVFGVVDDMPQLIGGLAGLQERLVYPQLAKDAGIEGQVVIQFVVNEEGRVQDAVVLRSPDDMLSEAALQAVRASRFEPGRIDGEGVKVRFAVPVTFRLPPGDGVDRGERLN